MERGVKNKNILLEIEKHKSYFYFLQRKNEFRLRTSDRTITKTISSIGVSRQDHYNTGAVALLSILLPIFIRKPCTKTCGDLTVGCDELCVTDLIIGGGTAGLSLANRLSANHSHDVLVIEAGGNFINEPLVSQPGNGLSFEVLFLNEPNRFHYTIQTTAQVMQVAS